MSSTGFFSFNITSSTNPCDCTRLHVPFAERCLKCFALLIADVEGTKAPVDWLVVLRWYTLSDKMTRHVQFQVTIYNIFVDMLKYWSPLIISPHYDIYIYICVCVYLGYNYSHNVITSSVALGPGLCTNIYPSSSHSDPSKIMHSVHYIQ